MLRYIVCIDQQPWTWQPSLRAARDAALCRRCHIHASADVTIVDEVTQQVLWRNGQRVAPALAPAVGARRPIMAGCAA